MSKERIAIVSGIRTPFCKAGGIMRDFAADDLGAFIVSELMARSNISVNSVDGLVFGNVLAPPHSANIARIISVKAGLPVSIPAFTVNRNCASGMEAVITAADSILLGHNEVVVAGGTESMSNFPVLVRKSYKDFFVRLNKAKDWKQKLNALAGFRPKFILPEIPEISDPLCGLSMGQTAEILAREFCIDRKEQDLFALTSQQRAMKAIEEGRFSLEIAPTPVPPSGAGTPEWIAPVANGRNALAGKTTASRYTIT